jgi:hypothetical protein
MSSTTPEKTIELNLTLEVRPETHIAVKLFCRLAERMAKAKSESEQLAAIRQFEENLEEAKLAQMRLAHLGAGGQCDCPPCELKRQLKGVIGVSADNPKSLIDWARVLVDFVTKGKVSEATKANDMFGNSELTVADYFAAGVSEKDCLVLLAVMSRGSFGNKQTEDKEAPPAAAPTDPQQEAAPTTA